MDTRRPKTVLCGYLLVSISTKISAFTCPSHHVVGLREQGRGRGSCSNVPPSSSSSSRRTPRRLSVAHKSNSSDYSSNSGTESNKNVDSTTEPTDRLGVGISPKDGTSPNGNREPLSFLERVGPTMAVGNVSRRGRDSPNGGKISISPGAGLATVTRTERGQRLRALNWVKQVRNDLTSAEFALNLNAFQVDRSATAAVEGVSDGVMGEGKGGKGEGGGGAKSKIDYDSIAERLEASLRTLQAGRPLSLLEAISEGELRDLTDRLETNVVKIKTITQAERGGRQGDSSEPSPSLKGGNDGNPGGREEDEGSWPGNPGGILDEMKGGINVKAPEFDLFIRDDGTVDWDGAIQSGREVARFGQELWDRINGQNPHEERGLVGGGGSQSVNKPPREIPEDSPVMVALSAVGAELESRLEQLKKELDALRADARAREVTWKEADGRLAQKRIRDKESRVKVTERQLQLHRINVDMERICYSIEQEIRESASSSSSEYRLLVAEFGLLDAQLSNLNKLSAEIKASDAINIDGSDDLEGFVIDEDELELVSREVLDLKNRLGMDLENPALTIDPEKVTRYIRETYNKIKNGLDFYWTGTNILGNDIGYALTLVSKAAQGSILKPREVRTLRRTAKDCMTFIPFVVILLIPLTPVGHVLVFSFIQRFFPDFFPSTYTDRRQNLLKMYTEVDKKVDADPSDGDDESDDLMENLRRNFMSTLNQAGSKNKHKSR